MQAASWALLLSSHPDMGRLDQSTHGPGQAAAWAGFLFALLADAGLLLGPGVHAGGWSRLSVVMAFLAGAVPGALVAARLVLLVPAGWVSSAACALRAVAVLGFAAGLAQGTLGHQLASLSAGVFGLAGVGAGAVLAAELTRRWSHPRPPGPGTSGIVRRTAMMLTAPALAAIVATCLAGIELAKVPAAAALSGGLYLGAAILPLPGTASLPLTGRPLRGRADWGYLFQRRRALLLSVLVMVDLTIIVAASGLGTAPPASLPARIALVATGVLAGVLLAAWADQLRESSWVASVAAAVAIACAMVIGAWPESGVAPALTIASGVGAGIAAALHLAVLGAILPARAHPTVAGAMVVGAIVVSLVLVKTSFPEPWIQVVPAMVAIALLAEAYRQLRLGPMPSPLANMLLRMWRLFVLTWHRVEWVGKHHVPATGSVILAANHTAGIDPFLMQTPLRRLVRWIMTEQYRFRLAAPLWRAIDPICLADDAGNVAQIRQIVQVLQRGELVGIFPEGRLQRGHRDLQPFEAGVAMVARRSGAAIVPVWISGTPVARSMWRHFLQPSRSRVVFGRPYRPSPTSSTHEVVEELRRKLAALAQASDP